MTTLSQNPLAITAREQLATDVDALIAELRVSPRTAADASRAESTERAYVSDWRDFCAFAVRIGRQRLPAEAETVALYITDLARGGRTPATIGRRLTAIAGYHRAAGCPSPAEHDIVPRWSEAKAPTQRQAEAEARLSWSRCLRSPRRSPGDLRAT